MIESSNLSRTERAVRNALNDVTEKQKERLVCTHLNYANLQVFLEVQEEFPGLVADELVKIAVKKKQSLETCVVAMNLIDALNHTYTRLSAYASVYRKIQHELLRAEALRSYQTLRRNMKAPNVISYHKWKSVILKKRAGRLS